MVGDVSMLKRQAKLRSLPGFNGTETSLEVTKKISQSLESDHTAYSTQQVH